ncbi:MAG: hypothetical protein M1828_000680 [Chrysothrix sp. TS-e1954]|nr:MAG: hypothetical protein M1828_000680 [Chrysothrix sp. TS-e1954]
MDPQAFFLVRALITLEIVHFATTMPSNHAAILLLTYTSCYLFFFPPKVLVMLCRFLRITGYKLLVMLCRLLQIAGYKLLVMLCRLLQTGICKLLNLAICQIISSLSSDDSRCYEVYARLTSDDHHDNRPSEHHEIRADEQLHHVTTSVQPQHDEQTPGYKKSPSPPPDTEPRQNFKASQDHGHVSEDRVHRDATSGVVSAARAPTRSFEAESRTVQNNRHIDPRPRSQIKDPLAEFYSWHRSSRLLQSKQPPKDNSSGDAAKAGRKHVRFADEASTKSKSASSPTTTTETAYQQSHIPAQIASTTAQRPSEPYPSVTQPDPAHEEPQSPAHNTDATVQVPSAPSSVAAGVIPRPLEEATSDTLEASSAKTASEPTRAKTSFWGQGIRRTRSASPECVRTSFAGISKPRRTGAVRNETLQSKITTSQEVADVLCPPVPEIPECDRMDIDDERRSSRTPTQIFEELNYEIFGLRLIKGYAQTNYPYLFTPLAHRERLLWAVLDELPRRPRKIGDSKWANLTADPSEGLQVWCDIDGDGGIYDSQWVDFRKIRPPLVIMTDAPWIYEDVEMTEAPEHGDAAIRRRKENLKRQHERRQRRQARRRSSSSSTSSSSSASSPSR